MYIWLQVLCKGAYPCHNIHDETFAKFEFEEMHYSLEWQGGNDCIVNTLPSICEQLTIFYFQETNQTVRVEYAIRSSLGFSRRYFQLMHGYSSNWVVKWSKKTLYHNMLLNSYKSFQLDHGRPNMRYEFAMKLRRTPKPSNASSLDSSGPYENVTQLETFILWNPGCDWLPLPVLCVDQSVMLF